MRQRVVATVCAVVVAGVAAGAALAGEVKGPPYQGPPVSGGIVDETNSTPAGLNAHSLCAFSGLNDYDLGPRPDEQADADAGGQRPWSTWSRVRDRAGVVISCRGN